MTTTDISVAGAAARILGQMEQAIVGKRLLLERILTTVLAGGHVLLTGIPDVDKTPLVRAISSSIAADLSRIRFTSDLLPSYITGTSVYDSRETRFN